MTEAFFEEAVTDGGRMRAPAAQPVWRQKKIEKVIVLDGGGGVAAVEDIVMIKTTDTGATLMRVAALGTRPRAGFLWGSARFALGVSSHPDKAMRRLRQQAFAQFKALHEEVLDGLSDTPLQAFLRFLGKWSPDRAPHHPEIAACHDEIFAFRFQYDDVLLHERHVAGMAWNRYIGRRAKFLNS